jgi:hypothetical protein
MVSCYYRIQPLKWRGIKMELRLLTDCLYGYLKAEKTALNLY